MSKTRTTRVSHMMRTSTTVEIPDGFRVVAKSRRPGKGELFLYVEDDALRDTMTGTLLVYTAQGTSADGAYDDRFVILARDEDPAMTSATLDALESFWFGSVGRAPDDIRRLIKEVRRMRRQEREVAS